MDKPAASDGWPSPARAWAWVALLLAAHTSSFVDRQILSLMVDPISRDLGITDTQFSLLQGLAFALFYTLMGIPLGILTDVLPRRAVISASVAVWSVMTALCGLSNSFGRLFMARIGVGIGEAGLSPAAYSMLSDLFPTRRLGRAMAVFLIGSSAGAGLAMMFGGTVITLVSRSGPVQLGMLGELAPWQVVFLWVALPGLPLAALMWGLKEPARRQRSSAKAPPFAVVLSFMGGERAAFFAPYIAGLACISALAYAVMGWAPAFFMRAHGLTPMEAGLQFGAVCLVAMSAGLLSGAWLAERLAARYEDAALRVCATGIALAAPFGIAAPLAPHPALSLILYAAYLFLAYLPWGVGTAALQVITPNEMRGRVSAIYLALVGVFAQIVGPLLVASLTDRVFQDKALVGHSLAVAVAVLAPAAALLLVLALRPFRNAMRLAHGWLDEPAPA